MKIWHGYPAGEPALPVGTFLICEECDRQVWFEGGALSLARSSPFQCGFCKDMHAFLCADPNCDWQVVPVLGQSPEGLYCGVHKEPNAV